MKQPFGLRPTNRIGRRIPVLLLTACLWGQLSSVAGQDSRVDRFLTPAESFSPSRFWTAAGAGATIYGLSALSLYRSWYANYDQSAFHTIDDRGGWEQVDKVGHFMASHTIAKTAYSGARWTGLSRGRSIWLASGTALMIQSTIEVMDGFSEAWGFSWSDMGVNVAGTGLFLVQQYAWDEQRAVVKVSSSLFRDYPDDQVLSTDRTQSLPLSGIADQLYGSSLPERFLKDYNAQTNWLSINLASFAGDGLPKWLNLAIGYGADNMFSATGGPFTDTSTGKTYQPDSGRYPRVRQFYLAPDVDLERIQTDNRVLKAVLGSVSWLKIPSPALELDSRGRVKLHVLFW